MTDTEFEHRCALIRGYFGDDVETADHSVRVGRALRANSYARVTVLAGLLHDALEDGVTDRYQLKRDRWPHAAVALAFFLKRQPYERYIQQYIWRLKGDSEATAVKLADIEDNLVTRGPPPGNLAHRYNWARSILESSTAPVVWRKRGWNAAFVWQYLWCWHNQSRWGLDNPQSATFRAFRQAMHDRRCGRHVFMRQRDYDLPRAPLWGP